MMSTAGYITPPDDGQRWDDEETEAAHWAAEARRYMEDTDYANGHVDVGDTDIHPVCPPSSPSETQANQSLDKLVEGLAEDIAHLRMLEVRLMEDHLNPDTLRAIRGLVSNIRESFRRHLVEIVDAAMVNDVHFWRG